MPSFTGNVLLISPIVVYFPHEATQIGFIPSRSERLGEMARAGACPVPEQSEIHVGADDWQSNPASVKAFGSMLGITVNVVPNAGHSLPQDYVSSVLDRLGKSVG